VLRAISTTRAGASSTVSTGSRVSRRLLVGIVVAVLIIAVVVALAATSPPPETTPTTTETSTSISAGASSIIASAVQTNPAGFVLQSSKTAGPRSNVTASDWAWIVDQDGSYANVTVIVFSSINASQTYFDRFVTGVIGLPGYTDITSNLASFQQYGRCYGYGEDITSAAGSNIDVASGVCTKGNVFLEVQLGSTIQFSSLEGDLTGIMGALYQSAT